MGIEPTTFSLGN